MLDMATFKEFFLVYRDSGLEHAHHSDFYGASAECANHGGAIAFPATNEHMAELVRLLAESDDAQGSAVVCAESGRLNNSVHILFNTNRDSGSTPGWRKSIPCARLGPTAANSTASNAWYCCHPRLLLH